MEHSQINSKSLQLEKFPFGRLLSDGTWEAKNKYIYCLVAVPKLTVLVKNSAYVLYIIHKFSISLKLKDFPFSRRLHSWETNK